MKYEPATGDMARPEGEGPGYQVISVSLPTSRAKTLIASHGWKTSLTLHAIGGELIEMIDEGNGRKTLRMGFTIIGIEHE